MNADWLIFAIVVLQVTASAVYVGSGEWKQGFIWGGIAVSNIAYLSLSRGQ